MSVTSCAVHLPDAAELWQDVAAEQRVKDPAMWICSVALKMGCPWRYVSALELLNRAHDEMLAATGKAFSILDGKRYMRLGAPGCAGRLNAWALDWEFDNKGNVKIVPTGARP